MRYPLYGCRKHKISIKKKKIHPTGQNSPVFTVRNRRNHNLLSALSTVFCWIFLRKSRVETSATDKTLSSIGELNYRRTTPIRMWPSHPTAALHKVTANDDYMPEEQPNIALSIKNHEYQCQSLVIKHIPIIKTFVYSDSNKNTIPRVRLSFSNHTKLFLNNLSPEWCRTTFKITYSKSNTVTKYKIHLEVLKKNDIKHHHMKNYEPNGNVCIMNVTINYYYYI